MKRTVEVRYEDMAANTPPVPVWSNMFREIRHSVRSMNRHHTSAKNEVRIRLVLKPGAILTEKYGQKFLITRKGKRLAI